MNQESKKGTPDEKIASKAKDWRAQQKQRIARPTDEARAKEFFLLREVAKAVDDAERGH